MTHKNDSTKINTSSINSDSMLNKVVLVTGASSGLGAHFATVLAKSGAKVIVGARRIEKLQNIVDAINNDGGQATAIELDVTQPNSVSHAMTSALSIYGPIDCLINNAGVAESKRFVNLTEDDWQYILNTNLTGAWRVAKAVTSQMLEYNIKGNVVNIASILGLRVGFGDSCYAISKAGVVQMTKAMALEFASKQIRVNALCPGYFKTEMNEDYFKSEKGKSYIEQTPAKRIGQLDELTGPLMLLCSDAGSFINGVALPVDGGHMVSSL